MNKFYPLTIFVLSLALGAYIYSLDLGDFSYKIPFSDLIYTMPVAMWVVFIVYAVFFITIFFGFFERFGRFLEQRALNNDKKTLIQKIKNKIIEKNDEKLTLKTPLFKELGDVLDRFDLSPKPHIIECENAEIKKLLSMHENLQNGEEIDTHKLGIPQTSRLFSLNVKNSIAKNYKNGLGILKNKNYIYELKKCAFIALLRNAPQEEIQKYKDQIAYDKDIALEILDAHIEGRIELKLAEIAEIAKNAKLSKDHYLALAKSAKGKCSPSAWMGLFEYLADSDENAENAYFYVLLELEMLEKAKLRLKTLNAYDFLNVRAYLDLKAAGKSYPSEMFFLSSACEAWQKP